MLLLLFLIHNIDVAAYALGHFSNVGFLLFVSYVGFNTPFLRGNENETI